MYPRYLNNNDYKSVVSPEAMFQITRSDETAIFQAEEDAEASIREYLTDNYMIEEELESGKALAEYDKRVTYPPGVHFYFEGQIVQSMMRINGSIPPALEPYWMTLEDYLEQLANPPQTQQDPGNTTTPPVNAPSSDPSSDPTNNSSSEPSTEPSQEPNTSSTEEKDYGEVEKVIYDLTKAVEGRNSRRNGHLPRPIIRRKYNVLPKPLFDVSATTHDPRPYSQLVNYEPGSMTLHSNRIWVALQYNGPDYGDIRIPGVNAWEEVEVYPWIPNYDWKRLQVVEFEERFYAMTAETLTDPEINPFESNSWSMIGDYDDTHTYVLDEEDLAVYENAVFRPILNPNADVVMLKRNVRANDPRNSNVKKHMVRLALYELYKRISPNNVSSARIVDYENSITWLRDANRCKINPGIPRKLDHQHRPVSEIAVATFVNRFDPRENMWLV